ncbi:MAG: M23 family metallopeptidase [Chitinophagales bacterium]|nr:M23 family metallopeptidase [Chitinophagales bacterium]
MSSTVNKKQSFFQKLKNKYRLVILNDETFEEQAAFRLSRLNLYLTISTLFVLLVLLTASTIIFTPLKYYIPGYGDLNIRKQLVDLQLRTDSLATASYQRDQWVGNVAAILRGDLDTSALDQEAAPLETKEYDTINLDKIPKEDIDLRNEIENEKRTSVSIDRPIQKKKTQYLADLHFYAPVEGFVTSGLEMKRDHFGVDIVAPSNTPVKAVLDGSVISASWTVETGYVISIQHENDLISMYKHNSGLLKKVGNFVKAGDVIAIIGNSGELSDGPHLHFELWHKGVPVNPQDYIKFN